MMKHIKTAAIILITCLFLAGCFSKAYVQQNKFMMHVNMPKKSTAFRNAKILQLEVPTITPQFADNSFVYRTSNSLYQNDYYNVFLIPAFQQVKQLLTAYLSRSPRIKHVVDAPSVISAQYVLPTQILALYADYRDRNNPKGVMTMQFSLFKHISGKYYQRMHITLSKTTPLQQKDSESLVEAWNTDLQKIFKNLSVRLQQAMAG